ncbi:MAG: hypothetical protein ACRC1F_00730 [Metamycoplasmataceae bacterium]
MDKNKTKQLLNKKYLEVVEELQKKYGRVPGDYFANENMLSQNTKIKRSNEGLVIHHIDEDKEYNLSSPKQAQQHSFSYQKADRLVYCNDLEHLLLHIKIVEETEQELIGSALFMIPELNNVFSGWESSVPWRMAKRKIIKDYKDSYLAIFEYCLLAENINIEPFFTSGVFEPNGWKDEYNYPLYFEFAGIARKYYNHITLIELEKSIIGFILKYSTPPPMSNAMLFYKLQKEWLLCALINGLNKKEFMNMIYKIYKKQWEIE